VFLDKHKSLLVEVHEHGAIHDADLGKGEIHLNEITSDPQEFHIHLHKHGEIKVLLSFNSE